MGFNLIVNGVYSSSNPLILTLGYLSNSPFKVGVFVDVTHSKLTFSRGPKFCLDTFVLFLCEISR